MPSKLTFDQWKIAVDRELLRRCGMTSDDLPDCCYHDWWQDGVNPTTAAARAIKQAKEY